MKNTKRVIMLVSIMVLSVAFVYTPAFGQQKYVLKFNHVLGQKEPYHLGFTNWAKAVEEKTKGRS